MTDERILVAMAVFEGKLPAESLTWEEIQELEEAVFDAISTKRSTLPHNDYFLQ